MIAGLENSGFIVEDTMVIVRLLDVCRENNVDDNALVIRFAKHALPPRSIIDYGFVDNFQDSAVEAVEEMIEGNDQDDNRKKESNEFVDEGTANKVNFEKKLKKKYNHNPHEVSS